MRARTVLAVSCLAAAALAAQGVSLRWTPKEGDELRYQTVGKLDVGGIQAEITTINVQKVLRVDSDGSILVEAKPVEGKAVYNGTELPVHGMTTQTKYGPAGEVKEIVGDKAYNQYVPHDIQRFVNVLARVPRTWDKMAGANGMTFQALADFNGASDKPQTTFSEESIRDYVRCLKNLWTRATSHLTDAPNLAGAKYDMPAAAQPSRRCTGSRRAPARRLQRVSGS